jgi:hypothetical protein
MSIRPVTMYTMTILPIGRKAGVLTVMQQLKGRHNRQ